VNKSLKSHINKWKNCEECDLCYARDKVVLYKGTVPCDVLLLGEAPGVSENTLGEPFIGPAGHLLDSALEWALDCPWEVSEIKLAFTNVIACIPREIAYDASGRYVEKVGSKVSEPPKDAVEACSERLREFHQIAQPAKVILIGKVAEKYAPKYLDLKIEDTIAITHPAAILRASQAHQALAYQRLCIQLRDLFEELQEEREAVK